jgi:hypothetical protein
MSSRNPYKALLALLPNPQPQIGTVLIVIDGVATIELPGGGRTQARGEASTNDVVFFRDGVIEGPAPSLPIELIEV